MTARSAERVSDLRFEYGTKADMAAGKIGPARMVPVDATHLCWMLDAAESNELARADLARLRSRVETLEGALRRATEAVNEMADAPNWLAADKGRQAYLDDISAALADGDAR